MGSDLFAQPSAVPRGFLLGDIYLANVERYDRQSPDGRFYSVTILCRIDVTRLAVELVVALSAATTIALFLQPRSVKRSDSAQESTV